MANYYLDTLKKPNTLEQIKNNVGLLEKNPALQAATTTTTTEAKPTTTTVTPTYTNNGFRLEDDPVYKAYADQYRREGTRAGEDTLGKAAAMTGGIPSSYAVTASQREQNYYNQKLTDIIPGLYDAAYARWQETHPEETEEAKTETNTSFDASQWYTPQYVPTGTTTGATTGTAAKQAKKYTQAEIDKILKRNYNAMVKSQQQEAAPVIGGDFDDAMLAYLVKNGVTQKQIWDAGYRGDWFKRNGYDLIPEAYQYFKTLNAEPVVTGTDANGNVVTGNVATGARYPIANSVNPVSLTPPYQVSGGIPADQAAKELERINNGTMTKQRWQALVDKYGGASLAQAGLRYGGTPAKKVFSESPLFELSSYNR